MRAIVLPLLLPVLIALGCARAQSPPETTAPPPPTTEAPLTAPGTQPVDPAMAPPTPTNPVASPATPPPSDAPDASAANEVDASCTDDADCAVKNVGSCCGYFPACVNKNSPTFPEQVQAECQAKGMMSTCGFQEPAGCACVDGSCASTGASLDGNDPQ